MSPSTLADVKNVGVDPHYIDSAFIYLQSRNFSVTADVSYQRLRSRTKQQRYREKNRERINERARVQYLQRKNSP